MSILSRLSISREEWIDRIYSKSHSKNSKVNARLALKKWDDFLGVHSITESELFREIKNSKDSVELYIFLDKFVQFMAKTQEFNGIKVYFGMIKSWIRSNDIRVYNEDVKQFVSFPRPRKEKRQPLTIEIISNLINNSPPKLKAVLLVLLSSGMRISEVMHLRVMDLDMMANPVKVRIRAETTKTREERYSFISSECYSVLRKYLEGKKPTDYVFGNNGSIKSMQGMFRRLRMKLGYTEKYSNELYHVNIHSFRSFFLSEATKILGGDIAHAMIGHHQYLDVYFRLTDNERIELYRKLEPYVTVSSEYRQQRVIEEKDRQLAELERVKLDVEKLKAEKYRKRKGLG